jgi:hypothetical protein
MPSSGTYKYRPLDANSRQIRLLTLYTSPNPESEIQCDLVHVSLDAHPRYTAMSYVWGVPEPARLVRIGGGDLLKVRPNLFAALRQHRSHFSKNPAPLVLWVDAICINQDDPDERSSQVQLMGAIYSEATYVNAWLGDASSDSKLAFDAIKLFDETAVYGTDFDDYMRCLKNPEYDQHWKALGNLLCREYWSRVWITQEVILSKGVMLVCGTDMCVWTTLAHMISLLDPRAIPYISDTAKGVFFGLAELPRSLAYLESTYERDSLSLTKWLSIGRQRKATDPRDHVIAVLGLTPNSYRVDCKKTKGEIFREITKYAISLEINLDVLSCCGSFFSPGRIGFKPGDSIADTAADKAASILTARASLYTTYDEAPAEIKAAFQWPDAARIVKDVPPSWVPNWSCGDDWGDLHPLVVNMRKTCCFQAAGYSLPQVRYIDSQEKMLARGVWVDDITASCPDVEVGDKERFRKEWKLWQEDCEVPQRYGDDVANRLAFKFTVAVGRNIDGAKLCLVADEKVDDMVLGLPQVGAAGDGGGPTHISQGDCGDALVNTVDGRRFFVTKSGFIGRGPLGLRVGDVVAVLLGGKVPFILRPSELGGGHLLIGEACKFFDCRLDAANANIFVISRCPRYYGWRNFCGASARLSKSPGVYIDLRGDESISVYHLAVHPARPRLI